MSSSFSKSIVAPALATPPRVALRLASVSNESHAPPSSNWKRLLAPSG
jgi:hypothetical protein